MYTLYIYTTLVIYTTYILHTTYYTIYYTLHIQVFRGIFEQQIDIVGTYTYVTHHIYVIHICHKLYNTYTHIYTHITGLEHPETFDLIRSLINIYLHIPNSNNDLLLLYNYLLQILDIRIRVYGNNHVLTISVINLTAFLSLHLSKYDEAELYYNQVIKYKTISLGKCIVYYVYRIVYYVYLSNILINTHILYYIIYV